MNRVCRAGLIRQLPCRQRRSMPTAKHRATASETFPVIPGIRMTADVSGSRLSATEFLAHVDDTCARVARDTYHQHGRGIIIVDVNTADDDEDLIHPQWLPLVSID